LGFVRALLTEVTKQSSQLNFLKDVASGKAKTNAGRLDYVQSNVANVRY